MNAERPWLYLSWDHPLKELRHGLWFLKNLAQTFQVHHLQSVLNFSILEHPFDVPFWFTLVFLVFVYPGKLLFKGIHILEGNKINCFPRDQY